MIGFFSCPSSCVYPGVFSFEGICPALNLALFITYVGMLIVFRKFIIYKIRKKNVILGSDVQ